MRCQTITNYKLRTDRKWLDSCAMVGVDNDEIFVVSSLNDRFFNAGFRIVNPDFNATPDRIKSDEETLYELLEHYDHSDPQDFHNFQKPWTLSKKEKAIITLAPAPVETCYRRK